MPHILVRVDPATGRPYTIDGVRALTWRGNFHQDRDAFDVVDDFVRRASAEGRTEEAKEALRISALRGMGEDDVVDDQYLKAYLAGM